MRKEEAMRFRFFISLLPGLIIITAVLFACSHSRPKTAVAPGEEIKIDCPGAGCSIIFRETNINIDTGFFKAVEAVRLTSSGEERLFILGDAAGTGSNGFKTGKWEFEGMSVFKFGGKSIFRASGLTSAPAVRTGILYVYRIDTKHGTLDPVIVRYPDFKGLLKKGESAGAVQTINFQDGRIAGAVAVIPGGEIDVKYRIGKAPDGEFSMYPISVKVRRKHQ
jgi:hypothetical protein